MRDPWPSRGPEIMLRSSRNRGFPGWIVSTLRASQHGMLTYTDVSADPSAFERSHLREAQIAEARALGFDSLAWVATPAA